MVRIPNGVGAKVVQANPLVGVEKDEITDLVSRIKRADQRWRTPSAAHVVPEQDAKWAADWQLPREVFDYFVIEHEKA